ncbi:hypothetical protein [Stomatohabitans albus]|uniref:hypothetical protein n=1 Tax=Stomatohabitans albus TaxID=3110766 RepID=UPI00300C9C55
MAYLNTGRHDQGSQSLEFALVSPFIGIAVVLVVIAGSYVNSVLVTSGVAQTLARQLALVGTIDPPSPYVVHVVPPHPKEGASFHVVVERPIKLPLPGAPTWTIRQQAWGVRSVSATP